ncbi:MAG: site-specific DNA-methyltransferase [Desulfobacterales bacterium]
MLKTRHKIYFCDARRMQVLPSASVDLIVTSPPYPMIRMWDSHFSHQDPRIADALAKGRSGDAHEWMHGLLDPVWDECLRVLKPGGFACINIGDATRSLDGQFALYPNHARVLQHITKNGFTVLPDILWRKQTNAPNKFMGSGVLPAGAYVTLEHEYILIARKGSKRAFRTAGEKQNRRASAMFWEERNRFFSDIWTDVKGTSQVLATSETRKRSAAFPFEVAYRLVSMYSVRGDVVLDPFWGTGTTSVAAMATARNSIGLEIDAAMERHLEACTHSLLDRLNHYIENRLTRHVEFVAERIAAGGAFKHRNTPYGFPVVTGQERELILNPLKRLQRTTRSEVDVDYDANPQAAFCQDWEVMLCGKNPECLAQQLSDNRPPSGPAQLKLF